MGKPQPLITIRNKMSLMEKWPQGLTLKKLLGNEIFNYFDSVGTDVDNQIMEFDFYNVPDKLIKKAQITISRYPNLSIEMKIVKYV
jgi:hypothetical protein